MSPTVNDLISEFYGNRDQESVQLRGSIVTPGVGSAVVVVGAPAAGVYEIVAMARYGGVPDVIDNMDVRIQGSPIIGGLPVQPVANGEVIPIKMIRRLNGAQNITINAVAAGAAGSVFIGYLVVTKIGEL